MTEEQLQSECAIWFWNTLFDERQMLFHVDNYSVNSIVGARKKSLGVCKGPSDFILVLHGATDYIEMKLPEGYQSPEQKTFQEKVEARGHRYVILRTVDTFKNYVMRRIMETNPEYNG